MKILKTFEKEDRKSVISLVDEVFEVEFFQNNRPVGTIEYTDKSYHYVEDAAENWIVGIMTKETVKRYQNLAA